MRGKRAFVAGAALCLLAATPAGAAPGAPDPSFGRGGFVETSFGDVDWGTSVLRQADGRVVVTGSAGPSRSSEIYLTRHLADGRIDTSFGTRGVTRTRVGSRTWGEDVEQLPDGRLMVAGWTVGQRSGVVLARYSADGALDRSFANGGYNVAWPVPGHLARAGDLTVLPDGGFAVSGYTFDSSGLRLPFVQRFLPDGRADSSFGGDGTVTFSWAAAKLASAWGVTSLPDGSLVVSGYSGQTFETSHPFLVRLGRDGSLDPAFGTQLVEPPAGTIFGGVTSTRTGAFLVSGCVYVDGAWEGAVYRLLPAGVLDPTFGDDGVATFRSGREVQFYVAEELPDGRVVAGGHVGTLATTTELVMARFTALGAPDTTFGRGGVTVLGSRSRAEAVHDLVVAPDGSVTTTGITSNRSVTNTVTARYLP